MKTLIILGLILSGCGLAAGVLALLQRVAPHIERIHSKGKR